MRSAATPIWAVAIRRPSMERRAGDGQPLPQRLWNWPLLAQGGRTGHLPGPKDRRWPLDGPVAQREDRSAASGSVARHVALGQQTLRRTASPKTFRKGETCVAVTLIPPNACSCSESSNKVALRSTVGKLYLLACHIVTLALCHSRCNLNLNG